MIGHPRAEALRERARAVRARAAVRRWEYRQRHHAKGVWFRLRRVLAEAAAAWSVPEPEVRALLAEGYPPESIGEQLEPPKTLIFAPHERIEAIAQRRPVALRLDADLLAARCLVLERL